MEKLAKMAMLDISDAEKAWADIEKVLKMAEILNEVNADECMDGMTGALREDKTDFDERDSMTGNAPSVRDGYIIVPKVVGE